MIGSVLTDLAPRVSHADLVRVADQTLTVSIDDGHSTLFEDHRDTLQVRIGLDGRLGWAAGATAETGPIVDAALRSAAIGTSLTLLAPAPAALPAVVTATPAARSIGASDLLEVGRRLTDRLARRDRIVSTWAERSIGEVEVGSTRGVLASYDVTMTGIGAAVQTAGGPVCRVHQSRSGPPENGDLELLVSEVGRRLDPPPIEEPMLGAVARVWFAPRAVRALLEPILARLVGERWLASRDRWPGLDPRITLIDDPLAPGRPGSRPICDDGVPTRELILVDRGRPAAGILDLVTASRHRLPATGHSWRRGLGGPRIGFTNVRMLPGDTADADLPAAVRDGLMVADLELGPAPNRATGLFRVAAPWSYLIAGGRIEGRAEGVMLGGDVFELLERVVAIGADAGWIGAWSLPSLVLDGVAVALR